MQDPQAHTEAAALLLQRGSPVASAPREPEQGGGAPAPVTRLLYPPVALLSQRQRRRRGWLWGLLGFAFTVAALIVFDGAAKGGRPVNFQSIILLVSLAFLCLHRTARHWVLAVVEPNLPGRRRLLWRNIDRLRVLSRAVRYAGIMIGSQVMAKVTRVGLTGEAIRMVFIWTLWGALLLEGSFRILGQRLAARSAQDRLRDDTRRPIIFLRSFADESLRILDRFGGSQFVRLEAMLATWFERLGPFVALGRPGERLPREGASRLYAKEDWQTHVNSFLIDAAVIVLVLADSSGLRWEVERIASLGLFSKTVVVFPRRSAREMRRRWRAFADIVSRHAPGVQLPPGERALRACVMHFDERGHAHPLGRRAWTAKAYGAALEQLSEVGGGHFKVPASPAAVAKATLPMAAQTTPSTPPTSMRPRVARRFSARQIAWVTSVLSPLPGAALVAVNLFRDRKPYWWLRLLAALGLALCLEGLHRNLRVLEVFFVPLSIVYGVAAYIVLEAKEILDGGPGLGAAPFWQLIAVAAAGLLFEVAAAVLIA
jgi:hypothetical protein